MTRTFLLVLAAAAMLPACSQNKAATTETAAASQPAAAPAAQPASAPKSNDAMQQKAGELAGSSAKDCGRPSSTDRSALEVTASCVMDTAQAKKPFTVVYDMPGMSVGVAGNAEGKFFALQAVVPEGGSSKASAVSVSPCPAELRIAQSGRVTCFPQGTMGVPPGGANPHAGAGSTPHGGMGVPPAGTPHPHAGGTPTTPPKSKTPLK